MVSDTLKWLAAVGLVVGATVFKVDACVERQQSAKVKSAHQQAGVSSTDGFPSDWLLTRLVIPSPVP